ncbi:aspartate aminotransferase family protein [Catenovulum sp. 2E275]|uniref:aspartate aminotransferase family protein n=1 Tax=Catenovulum sp. 2E275 TaxID=2980497 RepID=UPI0021D12D31|nr:aspartate aminotransferase family protein [Catenovulum sp. 2E275]MCU4676692.1 aspartate aminotransferase family protein [Catenovulum sp. 2E275]
MSEQTVTRATFDEVMLPNYSPLQMIPVKGLGSHVWDQEGREYIDFSGGIAVNCLGHCHPALVSAINEQSQKLWHVSNIWTNEPALQLAQKLVDSTFADKVFFCNSGAEANEAALKLARRYALEKFGAEKDQIIAFKQSFHGRTLFTVTAGGQPAYSDGFGPKPGAIDHAVYNDLSSLEALISDKTCAVILEPMLGEGGVTPATESFIKGVRELCNKHNALMILDEVQTGFGRTGHLYMYQAYGVTPDILSSAKSLGGGFPIGAILTTNEVGQHLKFGTHGTTYGGNPLGCAIAGAAFDVINTEAVLSGIMQREQMFREHLTAINEKYNVFSEIRGQGLLLGAVMNEAHQGQAREFMAAALEQGLMVLVAGANVVRFAPALVIEPQDIADGLARFEKAVARVVAAG